MKKEQIFPCTLLSLAVFAEYAIFVLIALDILRETVKSDQSVRFELLTLPGGTLLILTLNCAAGFEMYRHLRIRGSFDSASALLNSLVSMALIPPISLMIALLLSAFTILATDSKWSWSWFYIVSLGGTPLLYWISMRKVKADKIKSESRSNEPSPGALRWQRFTERARKVILMSQREAIALKSPNVGPEHILLGLLREQENIAFHILQKANVSFDIVQQEINNVFPRKTKLGMFQPGLSPSGKRILVLAADESRRMGLSFIGTEHLLLALERESESLAAQILKRAGLQREAMRSTITA